MERNTLKTRVRSPSASGTGRPAEVTSITVNADPRDWRNALACVIQEALGVYPHV